MGVLRNSSLRAMSKTVGQSVSSLERTGKETAKEGPLGPRKSQRQASNTPFTQMELDPATEQSMPPGHLGTIIESSVGDE